MYRRSWSGLYYIWGLRWLFGHNISERSSCKLKIVILVKCIQYKVRHLILLQSATVILLQNAISVITKCDKIFTKCDRKSS